MKHKHADLIHAWADGAQIQWKSHFGHWFDENHPDWSENTEYRIKLEPKPDVIYRTRVNKWRDAFTGVTISSGALANIDFTFDGETGELKSAEVLK